MFRKIRTNADEMEHPLGKTILIFLGCGAVATVIEYAPATCWNGLPAVGRGRHMQT
ncbi:MAG: hypothetical protein ACLUOF_10475 [Ruminococcus sp.]